MKNVLKQPLFFAAAGALVLALVIGVVAAIAHPTERVAEKFCKAMEKGDGKAMVKCLTPELQQETTAESMISGTVFEDITSDKRFDVTYCIGDSIENPEDESIIVPVTICVKQKGDIVDVYTMKLVIVEIDGKEYIRSYH